MDRIIYKCALTEADRRLINIAMHTFHKNIAFILLIPENIFLYIVQIAEATQSILIVLSKQIITAGFWTLLNRKCREVSVMTTDKQFGFKKATNPLLHQPKSNLLPQKRPLKCVSSGCFGRLSSGDNLTFSEIPWLDICNKV